MRIALLSDIHGNPIALDAVIEAVRRSRHPSGTFIIRHFLGLPSERPVRQPGQC